MTYAAVYAALLLVGGLSAGRPLLRRKLYLVCIALLFLFVSFRYEVGCDWTGYLNIYEAQGRSTIEEALRKREPLFWASNGVLHLWQLDYPYINVIAALVFFAGFHVFMRTQPDRLGLLILSFPILIMQLAMSGIRQAMAVGVLCAAFAAFNDRRLVRYVILVLLASGFHTSALVFLALAPFVVGKASRRNLLLSSAIGLAGLYFMAARQDTFTVYLARYAGTGTEAAGAPLRTALLAIVGAVFLLVMKNRWSSMYPKDYKLTYISSMLMIMTLPIVMFSSVIGDRVGYYLVPLQVAIMARFPGTHGGVFPKPVLALPYIAGALVLVVWMVLSELYKACYAPYSIWL